jgi:6-phosphogluconolactonase (cycloisomerase 2 family)
VALSPDGKSLYAVSVLDDAVAHFERNLSTGALTYQGCISGETESGPAGTSACALIASAASNGTDSGLDAVRSVALSADGTSLYVVSESDDAVARFARDLSTGALTYQGCISGETESGPPGTGACTLIASATPGGANSGLDALQSLAVSADGRSVYTVSLLDDAVARFDRNPATGALTYQNCITGESQSNDTACTSIGSATADGANSGLDELFSVALSPDGTSLYTVSESDDAVARFDRNVANGALTYRDCITGETESGPTATDACAQIGKAAPSGTDSGLDKLRSVAVSAGGTSLYAGSPADDAVARFDRDPATGALMYEGCITGEIQSGPTGTNACAQIASAASFGITSGLDNPQSFTVSADERSLYAASGNDAAVARFDLEPPPTTTTTISTATSTITISGTTSTTLVVDGVSCRGHRSEPAWKTATSESRTAARVPPGRRRATGVKVRSVHVIHGRAARRA